MTFEVEITETALREAEEYVLWIKDQSHDSIAAEKWWSGLLDAIFTLEAMPGRFPEITERKYFAEELRQIIYHSHRIIFAIENQKVIVLRIYHGSLRPLKESSPKNPRKLLK